MILLIANSKGGVGKTALATSIIAELAKTKAVIGVDLDSVNKSASKEWSANRTDEEGKFYYLSGDITDELIRANNEYDEVVIDAGGFDNEEFRRSIAIADAILIPVLVGSNSNIIGLQTVAEIIEKIRPDNVPTVYGVATRSPNMGTSPEYEATINELVNDPLITPCSNSIGDRKWYATAFNECKGITEIEPRKRSEKVWIDKAKNEFLAVFNDIYGE